MNFWSRLLASTLFVVILAICFSEIESNIESKRIAMILASLATNISFMTIIFCMFKASND